MMNKKAHGLVEVETNQLPNWLAIPLVILVCITLITVIFFFGVVGYSCLKGNCNAYYGMHWFGYPIVYNSQECYTNGIPVNCSELNYTPQGGWDEKIKKG